MIATPKQQLHEFVDRLTEEEARRLSAALEEGIQPSESRVPRPLTSSDIILAAPLMPDDESADELNQTVRRWRREGGYA